MGGIEILKRSLSFLDFPGKICATGESFGGIGNTVDPKLIKLLAQFPT